MQRMSTQPGMVRQYIRTAALARRLDVRPTTVTRWARTGRMPKPIQFSPGVVAFDVEEIEQWLATQRRR
jgi:predicted DNA-binding transcriptional regulator AlpA